MNVEERQNQNRNQDIWVPAKSTQKSRGIWTYSLVAIQLYRQARCVPHTPLPWNFQPTADGRRWKRRRLPHLPCCGYLHLDSPRYLKLNLQNEIHYCPLFLNVSSLQYWIYHSLTHPVIKSGFILDLPLPLPLCSFIPFFKCSYGFSQSFSTFTTSGINLSYKDYCSKS